MGSRLDNGAFTAAEVQTMARAVDVPVEKVRRLTELAVFVAGLDRAAEGAAAPPDLDVDELAQIIRTVDGDHSLGAGALAEAILARLSGASTDSTEMVEANREMEADLWNSDR